MSKVVVISPHHDDEIIGCGGAIFNHKRNGDQIAVIFMTAGWSGIYWEQNKASAAAIVQAEASAAAAQLKIDSIRELNQEDRNLSSNTLLLPLIKVIREEAPEIVYLPHAADGDKEHRLVHDVAKEAIWLAASDYLPEAGPKIAAVNTVLGYEVWRPMGSYQLALDITDAFEAKTAALACYQSQLQVKQWDEGILGLNRFRGVTSGVGKYAEVFQVMKISREGMEADR